MERNGKQGRDQPGERQQPGRHGEWRDATVPVDDGGYGLMNALALLEIL